MDVQVLVISARLLELAACPCPTGGRRVSRNSVGTHASPEFVLY